jgi:hypothetical protein
MCRAMSAAYQFDDRDSEIARLKAEIEYLRPFAPPRPPDGYTNVKNAEALSGYSAPSIYRMRRQGVLAGTKLKGRVYVDPSSIKPR